MEMVGRTVQTISDIDANAANTETTGSARIVHKFKHQHDDKTCNIAGISLCNLSQCIRKNNADHFTSPMLKR